MQKEIRIHIISENYEVEASLFGLDGDDELLTDDEISAMLEPEKTEIKTFGTLTLTDDGRAEVAYEETEASGMEGSKTAVSFDTANPEIVTMTRTGMVSTTLVFEKGKRHHCVYNTPYMPFEVCVKSVNVNNTILQAGTLELDYFVEIRGAKAERTKFFMKIMD
ncbi:MAG: DUF1934 domain-containing protein [Ruminococcaceae bacterium]|nr:DUF1934 domain-containing protein [Oscillospiraceae bacterium]